METAANSEVCLYNCHSQKNFKNIKTKTFNTFSFYPQLTFHKVIKF